MSKADSTQLTNAPGGQTETEVALRMAQADPKYWKRLRRENDKKAYDEIRARIAAEERETAPDPDSSEYKSRWRIAGEVATELKLSQRYVFGIFQNQTTNRRLAESISRITGKAWTTYHREPLRRGREQDIVAAIMHIGQKQFTFADFVADRSVECPPVIHRQLGLLNTLYQNDTLKEDFRDFEEWMNYTMREYQGLPTGIYAPEIWKHYKLWIVDKVASIARFDIEDRASTVDIELVRAKAEDFDFG